MLSLSALTMLAMASFAASYSTSGSNYEWGVDTNTNVGTFTGTASTYADCASFRSEASNFCGGLPEYDQNSGLSLHGICLTGFSTAMDKCTRAIDAQNIPYTATYQFNGRTGEVKNAMTVNSFAMVNNARPSVVPGSIGITVSGGDSYCAGASISYTINLTNVPLSSPTDGETMLEIEIRSPDHPDGGARGYIAMAVPAAKVTKTTITGQYVIPKEYAGYKYFLRPNLCYKNNCGGSSNFRTATGTNMFTVKSCNSPATGSNIPSGTFKFSVDPNTSIGTFDGTASTYQDCAKFRSQSSSVCGGLPEFYNGLSLSGMCLTGFSQAMDKCTRAIDARTVPYKAHFEFNGRTGAVVNMMPINRWGVNELASNNFRDTKLYPYFTTNENSGQLVFSATATTRAGCQFLLSQNNNFCQPIPYYVASTGASPHGDCLTLFSRVFDQCSQAADKNYFPFNFIVSVPAPSSYSKNSFQSVNSLAQNNYRDTNLYPYFTINDVYGNHVFDGVSKTRAGCQFFLTQNNQFCSPLPYYVASTGASPHGDCLTQFSRIFDQCSQAADKNQLPYHFTVSVRNA